jgi:hypothetical protein
MPLRFASEVCSPGCFDHISRPCVSFVCLHRLSTFGEAGRVCGLRIERTGGASCIARSSKCFASCLSCGALSYSQIGSIFVCASFWDLAIGYPSSCCASTMRVLLRTFSIDATATLGPDARPWSGCPQVYCKRLPHAAGPLRLSSMVMRISSWLARRFRSWSYFAACRGWSVLEENAACCWPPRPLEAPALDIPYMITHSSVYVTGVSLLRVCRCAPEVRSGSLRDLLFRRCCNFLVGGPSGGRCGYGVGNRTSDAGNVLRCSHWPSLWCLELVSVSCGTASASGSSHRSRISSCSKCCNAVFICHAAVADSGVLLLAIFLESSF